MAGFVINKLTEEQYNNLAEKQPNALYLITDSKDEERLLAKIDERIHKAIADWSAEESLNNAKYEQMLLERLDEKIQAAVSGLPTREFVDDTIASMAVAFYDDIKATKESIGIVTADLSDLVDGEANTFDLPPDATHGYMVFVNGVQQTVFENDDQSFTLVESPDEKSELVVKYLSV